MKVARLRENRGVSFHVLFGLGIRDRVRSLLQAAICIALAAAAPLLAAAQAVDRDPDLPPLSFKHEKPLPNPRLKWQPLPAPAPKAFSERLTLSQQPYYSMIEIPLGDGTYSSWAVAGYDMGGPIGLDYDISWGFNTASGTPIDPTKNMFELSIETNYLWNDTHYAEAYLSFSAPDGTQMRPWQADIPYAGPQKYKSWMLIMTDWFSICNANKTIQKAKFGPTWFSLARDFPFYFSRTAGCAGCLPDVGLQAAGTGQLEVIQWMQNGSPVPAALLASEVIAASLSGDGSAITNLNASAITSGAISKDVLPANALVADKSKQIFAPQYFLGGTSPGVPGLVVQGGNTNIFPNIAIVNASAPVNSQWQIVNRGDTGALVFTGGVPGDDGSLAIGPGGTVSAAGDVAIHGKLNVAEGSDKTVGQVMLQYGVATVATKAVTGRSRIFLSYAGVEGQPGALYSGDIVDGESFTIHSTSSRDNSPVNYWIIN